MVMSWIWIGVLAVSVVASILLGNGSALAAAVPSGAQAGIMLAFSMSGSICLWTGIGTLMEKTGLTKTLSKVLSPILGKIFPTFKKDPLLAGNLSANVCANFLGLGNAATPMGIRAAERLSNYGPDGVATNELCRLVVMNTASIQLIPATVAAVRVSNGCSTPFDILPAVWITSLCSVCAGLAAAWLFGKLWRK